MTNEKFNNEEIMNEAELDNVAGGIIFTNNPGYPVFAKKAVDAASDAKASIFTNSTGYPPVFA